MGEVRTFCPRCGDSVESIDQSSQSGEVPSQRAGLCESCYFDSFDLVEVPERIQVCVCSRCGAVHRGTRWEGVGADDYTDVAIELVSETLGIHTDAENVSWSVEPQQIDPNTIRMHCEVTADVRGRTVEDRVVVSVKISRGTCTRCGRIAGAYYNGTVQVRATDRVPTDAEINRATVVAHAVVEEMEATGDRNAFVTEVVEMNEGVDIKVSTNKIAGKVANRLVREFGGGFTTSETLVTEDSDGNPVYRVAYAVRLPPFTPGDIIDPGTDDGPILVTSVSGNLKGRRLTTGARYEAPFDDTESVRRAHRLGSIEDAVSTTLVTIEDEHAVQILDPESYRSMTIARPTYLDPEADTVYVLKSRAGLHVLPTDAIERSENE